MGVSRRGNPLDDWRISPLSLVLSGLIRAIAATVSIRFHDDATIRQWERARRPFILAFWHRHLVLMRYAYRGMKMNVLVSQSWDGELTSRTLGRLGIDTVRGSSSRGGANALRGAVRLAREGSDLAFTPDGPRGPLRVVQPGVVLAGMLTRLPVIPVAIGASRFRILTREILPNSIGSMIVMCTLDLGNAILMFSGLSFLGLGVQPPETSLGNMVGFGREYLTRAPWIMLAPAAIIMLTTLAISLVGDWLRDKLDPTIR